MKKIRKKHFVLLEIMIALVLIIFVTFPFLKKPIELLKLQMREFESLECEMLAEESFNEIFTSIFQEEEKWKKYFFQSTLEATTHPLSPKIIQFAKCHPKTIYRSFYFLQESKTKTTKEQEEFKKIQIVLDLSLDKKFKNTYKYLILVKKQKTSV